MTSAIQNAIARAKEAAAGAAASAPANLPATAPQAGTNVPAVPGRTLSMDDIAGRGISVDSWIGVKEFGILAGKDRTLVPSVVVALDMHELAVHLAVKFGNPPVYYKSYDGVTCAQGGSWADAVAKCMKSDPGNKGEYRAVDLPMTVLESVILEEKKQKKTVLEVGERIGHSTSTTNWRNWETFYKELVRANLHHSILKVELGYEAKSNPAGNRWGVLTFKFLGEIPREPAQAAAA